ncbi:dTDP-4-dehydrorhamnose 3,5-epimerase [Psychroserpens sp.]|uniref:dTDP-4-dehydrorhamnose 3,5-epimerase n=1 Tax=Psychroserpens sp. TaxID=2020870 RepID=UPI002B275A40|nr:dTDP-4-dehydrorhamnose 3,5-epimerase [Psychroserpens sp.]
MKVEETQFEGCFIISPKIFRDERGYFFESFNKARFQKLTGINVEFVQDNQSKSSKGVLRGLHFQAGPYEQAKIVTVINGSVLDVCVDLRPNSKSFGKHFSMILDGIDKKQLFIPRGFAHGFLVLEDETVFSYKCDNYYNQDSERGIIYNDKTLNIDWLNKTEDLILSDKDSKLPTFESLFV